MCDWFRTNWRAVRRPLGACKKVDESDCAPLCVPQCREGHEKGRLHATTGRVTACACRVSTAVNARYGPPPSSLLLSSTRSSVSPPLCLKMSATQAGAPQGRAEGPTLTTLMREALANSNVQNVGNLGPELDALRSRLQDYTYQLNDVQTFHASTLPIGSHARHTCVGPADDVDLLLVLFPHTSRRAFEFTTERGPTLNAADVLGMVTKFAAAAGIQSKQQRRSVKLEPATLKPTSLDVVPAFRCTDNRDYYWIANVDPPNHQAQGPPWILTSPVAAQRACSDANQVSVQLPSH